MPQSWPPLRHLRSAESWEMAGIDIAHMANRHSLADWLPCLGFFGFGDDLGSAFDDGMRIGRRVGGDRYWA